MSSSDLVKSFINKYGEKELELYLNKKLEKNNKILTIIGNEGLHPIPDEYLHGEIYNASSGSLNFDTDENILSEYKLVLKDLGEKLKEKNWEKVYFIPTGQTTLTLQIKLFVYHILRLSTIDLFYSKGRYMEIDIDYRSIIGK